MKVSRAEAAGLVGALVAHAVVLAWMMHMRAEVVLHVPPAPEETSSEVDLVPEPELSRPAPDPAGATDPLPAALAMARAPSLASASRDGPATPSDGAEVPAPPAASAVPLDLRGPVALSADALGLGGRNVFLGALPDATSAPPADGPPANVAPGVQQSLRDALHEHDHGVGLDIGGPIVSVAEELTRPSSTPLNSRAVFQVTADANGDVTSVFLVDASQGRAEWERVATSLRDALRSRKLHVPGGTGGVAITLEVASRWQLPSGHDPSTEVSILGIPVKKVPKDQKQPMRVEILKPELKIVEKPASPDTSTGVKLPQYEVQVVKLLGLDIDPTDLTPRPLRVVHARVVREKLL